MTTPSDAIGLSERLLAEIGQPVIYRNDAVLREAAAALDALQGEISQWANEVARYKAYAEKFDEENAALSARVKELEAARMGQIDYSVDLQRIIEGLCHGRTIREPQTGARHHYDMAIEYQARATCAEQEQTALIRDYQRVNSQLADEMQRATRAEQERDEALERLKPFASDFDLNDCDDRKDDDALEVSIKDLRAASDCVRRLASGPDKEKIE